MNNTGIDDEILDVWVGTNNGMNEKIKTSKFNWCAFLFGGYYYLYRKMYLIGALNILLSILASIFITIIFSMIATVTYGSLRYISWISSFIIPIINGFIFYPLYKMHIKNMLMKKVNQNFDPIQIAQLKGGVNPAAVGIGIAIVFAISVIVIVFIIIIGVIIFSAFYYIDEYPNINDYYDYDDYDWEYDDYFEDNDYYFNI